MVAFIPKLYGEDERAYFRKWESYKRQALDEAPALHQMQVKPHFTQDTPQLVRGEDPDKAYRLKEVVGAGAFGTVHLALKMDTGDYYALKVFKPVQQGQPFIPMTEIELYKKIAHISCIRLMAILLV